MYNIKEIRSKNHFQRIIFKFGNKLCWIKYEYRDDIHREEWALKSEKTLSVSSATILYNQLKS